MSEPIILIGGGGHCHAALDVLEAEGRFRPVGIVDLSERVGERVLGVEIIGTDSDLPALVQEYPHFLVAIGQIKSPEPRVRAFQTLVNLGANLPTSISPLAYVSPSARVGRGTLVMHHALVNAGAVVGDNCILNSRCLVEHDAVVGNHCHVSTGAVLNGGGHLGEGVFVGSGAVVRQDTTIGDGAVIGMGARVLRDTPKNKTLV